MKKRTRLLWWVMLWAIAGLTAGAGQGLAYTPQIISIPTCTQAGGGAGCTDYFGVANWANSPLVSGPVATVTLVASGSGYTSPPTVTITDLCSAASGTCGSGAIVTAVTTSGYVTSFVISNSGSGYIAPQVTISGGGGSGAVATATITPVSGGMRKFVDALPLLTSAGSNSLGQYIPIANPDTTTYPGADYYVLGFGDHRERMHSDLPVPSDSYGQGTKVRGYYQINSGTNGATDNSKHYLGPMIIATRDRPVRVLLEDTLPTGNAGDLFLPTDTTYMSAGEGVQGAAGGYFTQNREVLHLHGGHTPWISDGTPQQWITPAGENDTPYLKGDSFQNVPDMVSGPSCTANPPSSCITPSPSDGMATHYFTNNQSGRLLFYHDHVYGMTRLNVYAGAAAPYLIVDPNEESALKAATAPGYVITNASTGAITDADLAHVIPLVIQDKTFVPPLSQLNATDPTWNTTVWGQPGDFWFPHVYMTNQDPNNMLNMNPYGRWDYGPWFWPPQTSLTAGPLTIPCSSAAYPGSTSLQCPIIPNPSGTPESFMDTPVVNGTAYPVLHVAPAAYRFHILSIGNDRMLNLSWFLADVTGKEVPLVPAATPTLPLCSQWTTITDPALSTGLAQAALDGTGNPINGTGLPAGCWPQPTWPTPTGLTAGLSGVVPDPNAAGPVWIQIGTDSGMLPAPVVIPATPSLYETNPKSITIGNVATHGLLLGPAERADVIVDFSHFAGKTLILYNDAPAPIPGRDPRLDYFSGDGDQTMSGGAPDTQPGYGPNTRTLMQVIVDGTGGNTMPFSLSTLESAFTGTTGLFASTQNVPIVGESSYNADYNTSVPDSFSTIHSNSLTFSPLDGLASSETVSFKSKTIQELFTADYGRMNALLGTELPLTNFLTQTTIQLAYIDPPTEILANHKAQLWKITHNGVDTHSIHFHLFDVQVVNRVGWDGTIRQPDPNELGWKDTVRMNPLEDIVVALRPTAPPLPFTLPDSIRLLDTTQPAGTTSQFTGVDPYTGNPITVTNQLTNFGWEYVWHCHILGHEENDMMRTMVFRSPYDNDFNSDYKPDILWQNSATGDLLVWNMNGVNMTGYSYLTPQTTGDPNWKVVSTADFNSDGYPDLLLQNTVSGDLLVWFMKGVNETSYAYLNPQNPGDPNWKVVATGDFNNDGYPDLLLQNAVSGDLLVWYMQGTNLIGFGTPSVKNTGDPTWKVVSTGDFNGDGKTDILFQNSVSGDILVWTMDGVTMTGYVYLNPRNPGDPNWKVVSTGDYNSDGNVDLLLQNTSTGDLIVWYMNGINETGYAYLNPSNTGDPNWKVIK